MLPPVNMPNTPLQGLLVAPHISLTSSVGMLHKEWMDMLEKQQKEINIHQRRYDFVLLADLKEIRPVYCAQAYSDNQQRYSSADRF